MSRRGSRRGLAYDRLRHTGHRSAVPSQHLRDRGWRIWEGYDGIFFPRIQIVVTDSGQACADLRQQTRSRTVPFDSDQTGFGEAVGSIQRRREGYRVARTG